MAHILSVSYDKPLLRTRELMLKRDGNRVSSVLGFEKAAERCRKGNYDLIVVGHSIPLEDKAELVKIFREHCDGQILCLRRHLEDGVNGADFHVSSEDPRQLVRAVKSVLAMKQLLLETLDRAMQATQADFGNVQLHDPQSAALRIVAQRNFERPFLDHFREVHAEGLTGLPSHFFKFILRLFSVT